MEANLNYIALPSGILLPSGVHAKVEKSRLNAEKAMRGQFFSDYAFYSGFNVSGGQEKPADEVSYQFLRDTLKTSAIDRLIIDARKFQAKYVARRCMNPQTQVGFRVRHKRHIDPDFKPTKSEQEEINRRCQEVEEVILRPNPKLFPGGYRDVLPIMVEEELSIDRKAMVVFVDERGRPTTYHLVDGATIKPRAAVLLEWMQDNMGKYGLTPDDMDKAAEYASEEFGVDLTKAAWVQEINSRIVAAWTEDQMFVDITNPSIWIDKMLYGGGSTLERSLAFTSAFVNAWEYNQELFRINYPENALVLFGDYNPDGLEAFKRKIVTQAGPGSWQRLVTISAGDKDTFDAKLIQLRNTPKEMMYPDLLRLVIILKCACYRMHPSTINMSTDRGGEANLSLGSINEEEAIANAQEEGFHSLLQNHCAFMNRAIVWQMYDDLEMVFEGLNKEDEEQKHKLNQIAVQNWKTVDETRSEFGLPPLPDGMGKLPLNQLLWQQKQQNEAQTMGEPASPQGDVKEDFVQSAQANKRAEAASKGGPKEPVNNQGDPESQKVKQTAKSVRYLRLKIPAGDPV